MTDLEAAFLKHLGNTFVPYVGREEGLPKPDELIAQEREAQRKRQIEEQRKAIEALAKSKTVGSQVERVIRAVCAIHGVTQNDLIKVDRSIALVKARSHAMWLMKDRLSLGWSEIGRTLARDHGTVISNVKRFRRTAGTMPEVKEVDELLGEVMKEEDQ